MFDALAKRAELGEALGLSPEKMDKLSAHMKRHNPYKGEPEQTSCPMRGYCDECYSKCEERI